MVKNKKTVKLNEDALQDQTLTQAPAVPATENEVANASLDAGLETPAGTDATGTDMPADGQVPAVDETAAPEQPETFTAPLPGYVPSGWVDIKNLATAVAQETGDVEAAGTAPDAQVAAEPDTLATSPSDVNVEGEQPLVAEEPQNVQPQLESMNITNEELEMILEYRKYKANKLQEETNPSAEVVKEDESEDEKQNHSAGAPNVSSVEAAPISESAEVCPECGKEPCECDEKKMIESEVEDILGEHDETHVEEDEVLEEVPTEVDEEENMEPSEEVFDDEEVSEDDDLLARISAFLDDDSEEGEMATNVLEDTADFLDSLFDEDDDFEDEELDNEELDGVEDVSDDFDDEELDDSDDLEDEELDYEEDEEFEESFKSENRVKESFEGIVYPAGSKSPRESYEDEDNLVAAYKRESARKREAIQSYRNTMRESNFGKALSSSSRMSENKEHDSNSWANNRFEEKAAEHEKFNFSDLLNNGLLG